MSLNDYLLQHYTAKTAAAYQREIAAYCLAVPTAPMARHPQVAAYFGALRKRYSNAATLNRILCSIKVYYSYLCASGQRSDHPARSLHLRDPKSSDIQLQDLLTAAQLQQLLLPQHERYSKLAARNQVLISLLVQQALLPQELEELRVEDVDIKNAQLHTRGSAKTRQRTLPLQPTQLPLLQQYLQVERPQLLKEAQSGRPPHDQLLISARQRAMTAEDITKHVIRKYKGDKAEGRPSKGRPSEGRPKKVTALRIRQSVIASLLKSGHELRAVQVFAGHRYPSATEQYRQDHLEQLKTDIRHHHPLG